MEVCGEVRGRKAAGLSGLDYPGQKEAIFFTKSQSFVFFVLCPCIIRLEGVVSDET